MKSGSMRDMKQVDPSNRNEIPLREKYKDIIIDRRTDEQKSNMTTINVVGEIRPNFAYMFCSDLKFDAEYDFKYGLVENGCNYYEIQKDQNKRNSIPDSFILMGEWIDTKKSDPTNIPTHHNILGKDGVMRSKFRNITMPTVVVNDRDLNFYGAKLVRLGDRIKFETTRNLPITIMEIGEKYVGSYLMGIDGPGEYLEYHDTPHFHAPLSSKCSGYLILGKQASNNAYSLTAFRIPCGYGVYTSPNVIHSSTHLIGPHLVVYSHTDQYSTVIIKNNDSNIGINFDDT